MSESPAARSPFLLAVAAAMGVTIAMLILSALLSQNVHGLAATVQAYDPADGTGLWAVELDVKYPPQFADDLVLVVAKGDVMALDQAGDVIWRTPVPGSQYAAAAAGRVYVSAGGNESGQQVLFLDAANGSILWERNGTLLHAGADIAAVSSEQHVVLVRPGSGERIGQFEEGDGARFAGNDSALARLKDREVKVFTADGESFELPGRVPRRTWLLGIEGDAVVLSVRGADGRRTARGVDMVTGKELWRQPKSKYPPTTSSRPVVSWWGAGTWLTAPGEQSPSVVTLGSELSPVDGATRYFAIGSETYAVDGATNQVLWTRRGPIPAATTTGLAVFEYKARYVVVAADSGEVIAENARVAASRVQIAGGRVVMDIGPRVIVVADDRTVTELFDGKARLETVSRQYVVLTNRLDRSINPKAVMVFDLETGTEIFTGTYERVFGAMELDGDRLRFNHEQSATEVNVATGETKSINRYSPNPSPEELDPTPVALAFNPELTRLLWTAEATANSSVAAVGDSIVISTWREKRP